MCKLLLILATTITVASSVVVFNNATVCPLTLLTYTKPHRNHNCTLNVNNILGVGQKAVIDDYNKICVAYSVIFPMWNDLTFFTNVSYVELVAKVVDHYLEYSFVLHTESKRITTKSMEERIAIGRNSLRHHKK